MIKKLGHFFQRTANKIKQGKSQQDPEAQGSHYFRHDNQESTEQEASENHHHSAQIKLSESELLEMIGLLNDHSYYSEHGLTFSLSQNFEFISICNQKGKEVVLIDHGQMLNIVKNLKSNKREASKGGILNVSC